MFNANRIPQRHVTRLLTAEEVKAIYCSKPVAVQIVLKAYAVKMSLAHRDPDWEVYVGRAVEWWAQTLIEAAGMQEMVLADAIIQEMRRDPFWGKHLREGTN